ncbi:MAG: hypothetical protein ACI8P0_001597 [Planctomycetaceae bacterium]
MTRVPSGSSNEPLVATTLGEVCAKYGAAYLDRYGARVPTEHRRVLQLIADCGTGRLGSASYRCAQCAADGHAAVHHTNASCGNRHCPGCQTANNGEWCVEQTKKLLPCEYFFVTFTIPSELRRFVRSNQQVCYRAMFDAAAGDRRAKRTHFGERIGVDNGPTVAVSGSFELFSFEASEAKDAEGGRLRTDQACSS